MKAHCQCGAITVTTQGPPKGGTYCHCGMCRRSSGAAFAMVAYWAPEMVTFEGELHSYRTSSYLNRYRCATCGCHIYNELRIEHANLEAVNAALFGADAAVQTHHIYYADRVVDMHDGLPTFDAWGRP